jgi:hypothetical protein
MPPRVCRRRVPSALAVGTAAIVVLGFGRPAAAQTVFQLDGALNLNYTVTTPSPDPGGLGLQLSPGLTFQIGSQRLVWRVGYAFTGTLNAYGAGATAYSNQLNLALAAELSDRTTMIVSGWFSQGGTALLLSQRPADTGQPGIRAPGSPDQVTALLGETLAWEMSPRFRLTEAIVGTVYAPQDALAQYNVSVAGSLRLDRTFSVDAFGGELDSSVTSFSPRTPTGDRYLSITNSLLASWRHDVDVRWSGSLRAGIAQVVTLTGSVPLAIVPTGGLTASYRGWNVGGALALTYGPVTNLQTGTVTQGGSITVRGSMDLETPGILSASAGFLRSRPLDLTTAVTEGIGDAVQGDVGFLWGVSDALLATARGTVAYQFNQPAGFAPSLVLAIVVGVTGRYSNAAGLPPMPTLGERVDGGDSLGFSRDAVRKP